MMARPHLDAVPEARPLPPGYTLRLYDPARDRPSLAATLAEAFGEPWDNVRLERQLTAAPDVRAIYVVAHGDRVVGTTSSRTLRGDFPSAGYVHWVGVATAHLRRGLGAALLARTLRDFRERGDRSAVLETDDFRIPAIRSYLKFGFLPIYDARGEDHRNRWSAVMERVVAPASA